VRSGLLKGRSNTLIRDEAYRRFFMHRTGIGWASTFTMWGL